MSWKGDYTLKKRLFSQNAILYMMVKETCRWDNINVKLFHFSLPALTRLLVMRLRSASNHENNIQNAPVMSPNIPRKLRKRQGRKKTPTSNLAENVECHVGNIQGEENNEHQNQAVLGSDKLVQEITLEKNYFGSSTNKRHVNDNTYHSSVFSGIFKKYKRFVDLKFYVWPK